MADQADLGQIDQAALRRDFGQIVLVLQGGGALGAYQAGVFQALDEAGVCPDWVIGTSIGAINAVLIAGNKHEDRLARLKAFWDRVTHEPAAEFLGSLPFMGRAATTAWTVTKGVRGFFEPNWQAMTNAHAALGAEHAGYYVTDQLRDTLNELVDWDVVNDGHTRLTVGAADVATAEMVYFDSRDRTLDARHVMASGALPPAFPAVRIDGNLYWDGGCVSNTPLETVFDDNPRKSGLIFAVHIWNPQGDEPDTIWKVMSREKDVRYASRAKSHVARQKQIHRLRHVIKELHELLPPDSKQGNRARALASWGCTTRMHVLRLVAQPLYGEDHSKDIDFSAHGVQARWAAGYQDTARLLSQRPWEGEFDPMEGLILHEAAAGVMMAQG